MRHLSRTNRLPRVLIAEDHAVVTEGLCSILQKSYDIIGIVQDGRELLVEAPRIEPGLIVLDIGMPVKFVFLTMKDDPNLAAIALTLGKVGHVLKHSLSFEVWNCCTRPLKCFEAIHM